MSEQAQPPTMTFSFIVDVQAADVVQILLNGSAEGTSVELPATNAGAFVADVTVVTHSGKPYTKALTLSGIDATKFTLTNGGVAPCDMNVGPASIGTGSYSIKITAP